MKVDFTDDELWKKEIEMIKKVKKSDMPVSPQDVPIDALTDLKSMKPGEPGQCIGLDKNGNPEWQWPKGDEGMRKWIDSGGTND